MCPSVLPMLLCLNMPGTLFDAEADMQVNICPQFIVTQLAQREPSGRIISVIVADRCARNSAPPAISTLGIIITLLFIALLCLLLQITELGLAGRTAALEGSAVILPSLAAFCSKLKDSSPVR